MGENDERDQGLRELRVESLGAGGRGVGRLGGKVWFVDGGLPGDRLLAAVRKERPRYVEAEVREILEPSADRREAACPLQGRCGGCPWMLLPEEHQVRWKRRIVRDAVQRIGGIEAAEVAETVPSPLSLGYRGKVEFTLGTDGQGRRTVGLHGGPDHRELIDVPRCPLLPDHANRILDSARRFLLEGGGEPWKEVRRAREPLRLIVRQSFATGEVLVAVRGPSRRTGPWRRLAAFLEAKHLNLRGMALLASREGRRGGAETISLAGKPWIREELGGTPFRIPAGSFFQVNPGAAERLLLSVTEACGPVRGERILDLYGGIGSYAFPLARDGADVTVCEADTEAVRCGRETARRKEFGTPSFVRGDVLAHLRHAGDSERGPGTGLVLANPPRGGLGKGVAAAITRLAPRRIVMVSCDPATLGRDLGALAGGGYRIRRIVPVDLFPQTPHVETVSLLERN